MTKAAVCRVQGEPLVIEDVAVAQPGPNEVRVDIAVCAICHSDITYAAGGWGGETPAIYGHEAAGVVESVGVGVVTVVPGQRVVVGLLRSCGSCFHCVRGEENLCIGDFAETTPFSTSDGSSLERGLNTGAFASRTVVHQSQVVAIPDDIPLASACLLACGVVTGFGAVTNTAKMPAGSTAAVIGAGGVGIGAIQGAAHAKATVVTAVDLTDDKLTTARTFGATETINGSVNDVVAVSREITSGIGFDYVFVTVGVGLAIDQAIQMVRRGGTVVLVGMPASGVMTEIEAAELAGDSVTIIGSKMGSARMSVDVPYLIELYRSGELLLDEMVSNVYPVAQINEAIEEVASGSVVRNVVSFS